MNENQIALVTGGNRGLGFETCRKLGQSGYKVILSSRNEQKGQEKVKELQNEGLDVTFLKLDVADPKSIEALHHRLQKDWGRLDVLVNNAGILIDREGEKKGEDAFRKHRKELEETLQTNLVGAYELCDRLIPIMQKHGYGRVVNVSSTAGQLADMSDGYESYRISKAGLNAVTRIFAAKYRGNNILVNSVCPGWVRTDMGGSSAPRSLEEGVKGIIWAATLPDEGPTGGFFRDGNSIPW